MRLCYDNFGRRTILAAYRLTPSASTQISIHKRGHQASLMSKIYADSSRVTACIADAPLRQVPGHLYHTSLVKWLQKHHGKRLDANALLYLKYLASFRYFNCVWVIQEMTFANTAYLRITDDELLFSLTIFRKIQDQVPTSGALECGIGQIILADNVTCLHVDMRCGCSDGRDRVYAMPSLMGPRAQTCTPIDYSLCQ